MIGKVIEVRGDGLGNRDEARDLRAEEMRLAVELDRVRLRRAKIENAALLERKATFEPPAAREVERPIPLDELLPAMVVAAREYDAWLERLQSQWDRAPRHPSAGKGVPASEVAQVLRFGVTQHEATQQYFAHLGIEHLGSNDWPWGFYEEMASGIPDILRGTWDLEAATVGALGRAKRAGLVRRRADRGTWLLTKAGERRLAELL